MSKTIVVPITAILLLISLPAYFAFIHNAQDSIKTGDTEQLTKEVGNLTADEITGEVQAILIFTIGGIIVGILGFLGIKVILK
jgi:hypothetical protein